MFNRERIESLEQSVATLTEELQKKDNQIESLFVNIQEIVNELNSAKEENIQLKDKYDMLTASIEETIDNLLYKLEDNINMQISKLDEDIKKLNKKSDKSDVEHNNQISLLYKSTDNLVKKCNELQSENEKIINEHNAMITKYEENIKAYQEQIEHMKNNILKKMNMDKMFEVKEE